MPMPLPIPSGEHPDEAWKKKAACKALDKMDIFFPEEPVTSPRAWDMARTFCKECTVKIDCLYYAVKYEPEGFRRYGMFGGMTPRERDTWANKNSSHRRKGDTGG